jgi:large subunit ribosomal protein L24
MEATKTKFKLKKGDEVQVIAGKDKGRRGKITRVLLKQDRVVVEGVNSVKRHAKPSQKNPQGGIVEQNAPIHVSNVMIIDPKTDKPTRIGRKLVEGKKGGKPTWVRIAKGSGTVLDQGK